MKDYTRELSILYAISHVATQSLQLDDILNSSLDKVLEVLEIEAGAILLLNPDGQSMTIRAHRGYSDEFIEAVRHIRLGEGVAGSAAAAKKPLVVDMDHYPSPRLLPFFLREGVQVIASTPLLSKGQVLGALSLGSRRPRAYPPDELELLAAIGQQLGGAVDNARLHQAAQNQVKHLAILNRIANALNSTLNLDELLEIVHREVTAVLEADAFFIALYDQTANELDYRILVDQEVREPSVRKPLAPSLTSCVVTEKRPLLVRDMEQEKARLPPIALWGTMKAPRSWLGVPMLLGDPSRGGEREVVGIISVQSYHPQAYGEEEQLLLTTIADQVAVAIQNIRLFEAEQRRAIRLSDIVQLGAELARLRDVDSLLHTLVSRTISLADSSTCTVMLVDETANQAVLAAQVGLSDDLGFTARVPLALPIIRYSLETGEPIIISDIEHDAPAMRTLLVRQDIQAFFAYPMRREGRVLGFITLSSPQPRTPSSQEIATYQLLAELAASALETARLFGEARQRVAELEVLQRSSMQLTSSLDLPIVLDGIVENSLKLVGAANCHIYLYDEASRTFSFGAALWADRRRESAVTQVRSDGFAAAVARSGSPVVINDATHHPLFTTPETQKWDLKAIAGFPLKRAGRVHGVLTVAFQEPHAFTEANLRVLGLLADQAAIAIENARLYEQERRRAAQLAVVNEVGRHATSTLELDEILHDVTAAIQTGFHYYNVDTFLVEGEDAVLKTIAGGFVGKTAIGYRQPLNQGIIGWSITHNQTVFANDITQDPRYIPGCQKEEVMTRSELCVPIHVEAQVLGALDVQSTELNAFDQSDVVALEILADQIALACKNALAYGRLDAEKERLELLYEVAAEVNSSLDLDATLARAVESITTRLGGKAGYVYLLEPGTDRLRLRAVAGIVASIAKFNEEMDTHVGQGLVGWVTAHGQPAVVDDVTHDERWLYYEPLDRGIRSVMSAPLMRGGEVLGAISVLHPAVGFFDEAQCRTLVAIAQQVSVAIVNARLHETVREQSLLDSLTQVYNHGELINRLHAAVEEAAKTGQPVSYIMLDIDYFKEYNDRYGHVTGDLVLGGIVHAIRANIKKNDVVGRWGGEEFGIVLPNTNVSNALIVAQRIRHTLTSMPLQNKQGEAVFKPTVSQGIAAFPTDAACADELIDRADIALYRAKSQGRDQIATSET